MQDHKWKCCTMTYLNDTKNVRQFPCYITCSQTAQLIRVPLSTFKFVFSLAFSFSVPIGRLSDPLYLNHYTLQIPIKFVRITYKAVAENFRSPCGWNVQNLAWEQFASIQTTLQFLFCLPPPFLFFVITTQIAITLNSTGKVINLGLGKGKV